MTNPLITKAARAAADEAVKFILTNLTESQEAGLFLPDAIRRLRDAVAERYGMTTTYLDLLVGDTEPPAKPQPLEYGEWLRRVDRILTQVCRSTPATGTELADWWRDGREPVWVAGILTRRRLATLGSTRRGAELEER